MDEVAKFFDSLRDEYDASIQRCVPRYDEMLDTLVAYLPESVTPRRIAELGCGTGNLTARLLARWPDADLTLIDISEEMLEACRQRFPDSRLRLWRANFLTMELEPDAYDLIVSSIAIHHLPPADKQRLFQDVYVALCDPGIFSYCDQFAGAAEDVYRRHMESWRTLAEQMGATSEEWRRWMDHQDQCDYHEPLLVQMQGLADSGFRDVDCVWRNLLWTILQARKTTSAPADGA